MNISVDDLKLERNKLEDKYDAIEKDIHNLYSHNKLEMAKEKEKIQSLLDIQITYLDQMITNLLETPKIYVKFSELNREYKELAGE